MVRMNSASSEVIFTGTDRQTTRESGRLKFTHMSDADGVGAVGAGPGIVPRGTCEGELRGAVRASGVALLIKVFLSVLAWADIGCRESAGDAVENTPRAMSRS